MVSKAQAWLEGQALRDPRRVKGQDNPAQWCRWKGDLESIHLFGLVPMAPGPRWDVPTFALEDTARWMHLFSGHLEDCVEGKHHVHNLTAFYKSGGARLASARERARRKSHQLRQKHREGRARFFDRARDVHGIHNRGHRVTTTELHPRPVEGNDWWGW